MRKIAKHILVILNIVAIIFLIASVLSVYINPNLIVSLAIIGMVFPIFVFVIILFLTIWIIRKKKKHIFLNVFFLIASMPYLTDLVQLNFKNDNETTETIKVMTFNVRLFDYYVWKNNMELRDKYFEYIKSENPDIICFQEFFSSDVDNLKNIELLKNEVLKTQYAHIQSTHQVSKNRLFGIATFSKYPIINKSVISFEKSSNMCIYTDLLINNDTVRVYNNHLQSIKFQPVDYEFVDSLNFEVDSAEVVKARNIITRLAVGFRLRAEQADVISENIKNCKFKKIVCGDFNDTPISYTYHKMVSGLNDSFIEAGNGIGNTYNGAFPSYRIDYIFYNDGFECIKCNSPKVQLSDHYPVISFLKIKSKLD